MLLFIAGSNLRESFSFVARASPVAETIAVVRSAYMNLVVSVSLTVGSRNGLLMAVTTRWDSVEGEIFGDGSGPSVKRQHPQKKAWRAGCWLMDPAVPANSFKLPNAYQTLILCHPLMAQTTPTQRMSTTFTILLPIAPLPSGTNCHQGWGRFAVTIASGIISCHGSRIYRNIINGWDLIHGATTKLDTCGRPSFSNTAMTPWHDT